MVALHSWSTATGMINPNDITHFDRTDEGLIEFWHFALFVRGKNADVQARKLARFHACLPASVFLSSPIVGSHDLLTALQEARSGQYYSLHKAILASHRAVIEEGIDFLRLGRPEDLESIPGVGPKTARYFILHSRPNARVAALDTHILRWLGHRGYEVPLATPSSSSTYRRLEDAFIHECDAVGRSPADMDLDIWKMMRSSQ